MPRRTWIIIFVLLCVSHGALAVNDVPYWINPDGQTYKAADGTGEIVLNYKADQFEIVAAGQRLKVPLKKSFQERGQFFFITRAHALWVCSPRVSVPAEWNQNGKSGFQADTPVVIFFENGKEKYRLRRADLGFAQLVRHPETVRDLPSGPARTPESEGWLASVRADVPDRSNPRVSAAAFVPRLHLEEASTGKRVAIEVMLGRVMPASAPVR